MKIVVVSDSHGNNQVLENVLFQHQDASICIHCGDIECSSEAYPQLITVRGNNDVFYDYPDFRILHAENHGIYIVHSHQFMYSHRLDQMAQKAVSEQCDIVFYGHTHIAAFDEVNGVKLLNPGSLWRSRDGRGPSYAIVELEESKMDVRFEFLTPNKKHSLW